MPNGESKNWIRFQISLESFFVLYGRWPTKINLYPFFIEELQEKFSLSDFQKITSRIELVPDDGNPFLCIDDPGNKFDYSKDLSPPKSSEFKAIDWLGIEEASYYD